MIKHFPSHRALFLQNLAQTSPFPLAEEIVDSQGVYLINKDGRKIMDLICGISVSALGHKQPEVIQATKDQLDRFMHTMVYGEFVLSPQVLLAGKLCSVLPQELDNVYFLNSGSEAVEAAIKMALKKTGRKKIVAASNAYHGSTLGAMSLMSDHSRTDPFGGSVLDIEHINFNDVDDLTKIDASTAGVIVETIQAESGLNIPSKDYMMQLRKRCSEQGALFILDEIQAGMGRTGKLFAFEHFDIVPDLLLLAKALGGGMPLSACIGNKKLMDEFSDNPILGHISTFGGHPVSCAAALASFEVIFRDKLWEKAEILGSHCLDLLSEHPEIKDYRRIGLWAALELHSEEQVFKACEIGLKKGVLIDWFLFNSNSIRLCPPLNISEEELMVGVEIIQKILQEI